MSGANFAGNNPAENDGEGIGIYVRFVGWVPESDPREEEGGHDSFRGDIDPNQMGGDVTITNCTANGNDDDGFAVDEIEGAALVSASIARDNGDSGVHLFLLEEGDVASVNGSILCGNLGEGQGLEGLYLDSGGTSVDAEGNWWGCPDGPTDPACDGVVVDAGSVDFSPFVNTIRGSATVDPVTVGDSTVVSFQFSNSSRTHFLGQGPGDLRGPAPFALSTDNGALSDGGFINQPEGVLRVTLIPDTPGTATVTAVGPCGLDEHVVLTVLAVPVEPEEEFVPEPGSVILLASGLMGLAGYATLRWRARE
jgi:hypothetical protein